MIPTWESLAISKMYSPPMPFSKVKVCIVCPRIDELKAVKKFTPYQRLMFKEIHDELLRSNGVKLRGMGNLQVWETRGVLLLDPNVIPSKGVTSIISKLSGLREGIHFILISDKAALYKPMIESKERNHTLQVVDHPMRRNGSFRGSGLFSGLRYLDWKN